MGSGKPSARDRILDVAERLFADQGFKNVSLRTLTAEAGVNLASVRYYFGSKEGLLYAIYERYSKPLNEERLRRLEMCAEEPGRPPLLEQIIAAFIEPALDVSVDAVGGGAQFTRLRTVLMGERLEIMEDLIARNFDQTSLRFIDALCEALPDLGRTEVLWRFSFLLGALHYTQIDPGRIRRISRGVCDPANSKATTARMVPFLAQGFLVSHPAEIGERPSGSASAGGLRRA